MLSKQFSLPKESRCQKGCSTVPDEFMDKEVLLPGGRFRENYYWDSYWMVKGLLASDMLQTALGVLDVLFAQIGRLGFVPNGLRVYYEGRSQPPLLALMVNETLAYLEAQGLPDKARVLREMALPHLKQEFSFWMANRSKLVSLKGLTFNLSFYSSAYDEPRPECHDKDTFLVQNLTPAVRSRVLRNINAAAESGWDFSTRWMSDPQDLTSLRTTDVIPTDLNYFLTIYAQIISRLERQTSPKQFSSEYDNFVALKKLYFSEIFDERSQTYPDWNGSSSSFYSSSVWPHLLGGQRGQVADLVEGLLARSKTVPSASDRPSGQQWDWPNVWAPNVHALYLLNDNEEVARRWITTVSCGWQNYRQFLEKYDARRFGQPGGGGEYVIQEGFGWTNGLTIWLLARHPNITLYLCD